jgi:biofilm PGA synthesis N-glycosyltransferase PgaC
MKVVPLLNIHYELTMEWLYLITLVPYFFLLIRIYLSLKKIKPFINSSSGGIFLSIIVPCRNEEKDLPLLLSDIAGQTYNPGLFEVIIVDDNSTDTSYALADGFSSIKNMKVLRNSGRGKKRAVKTGIESSRGSLVITCDADCRMGQNWLKTISATYIAENPDMIICPVRLESGKGFFRRFQELEFLGLQGITAGTATDGNPVMCNGANLAFKREVFNRHSDNLHEELASGDDVFLLHSIKKEPGSRVIWLESSEAVVTTRASGTLFSFLRQRARWISKSGYYDDKFTKALAIVTFVTIIVQILLLAGGVFSVRLLLILGIYTALKSVPDFLILSNTTLRYGENKLMRWFLPSLLFYPFYVLAAGLFSLAKRSGVSD